MLLSSKTSFSQNALSPDIYIVSVADDVKATLSLKNTYEIDAYELDREDHRQRKVATMTKLDNALILDMQRDVEYELVMGKGPSAFEIHRKTAKNDKPNLDFKVKSLQPCGIAPKGTEVVVQAENPSGEGSGNIVVADKVGADGKAFLHWDWAGHWLEYAFDVPSDGAYELQIKYCIGDTPAFRALLVDGFLPSEALRSLVFAETGGWSSTRDDWHWQTISIDGGKTPYRFNLTKGLHKFTFINIENSMNMDVLKLKALQ